MSADLLIGVVGFLATVLVVAGMILLAPRGTESSDRAPELGGDEDQPGVRALRHADVG